MSKRKCWIDMIKGFAIISVVLGHGCERIFLGGYIGNLLPLHYMDVLFNSYHMPLFFMVSGYVYRMSEDGKNSTFKDFVKKKAIDYLLPYSWFAIAVWVGKFIFSKFVLKQVDIVDLLMMWVNPIAFLWYIYVLFFVSVLIYILEKAAKNKPIIIILILTLMLIVSVLFKTDNILVTRFLYYPLFYYIGVLFYRNKEFLNAHWILVVSGVVWLGAFIPFFNYRVDLLKFIENMSGAIFFFILFYSIFKNLSKNNLISMIGVNSLYVYIIHPIIMNASKLLLEKLGFKQYAYLSFAILVFTGVFIPMAYAWLTKKLPILELPFRPRKFFLEKSTHQKIKDK